MTELKVTAEPGVPQVLTSREFDAPRDLIYRAFTEPDLLTQWLGPRGYMMKIDRYDLRDGGSWRYTHATTTGTSTRSTASSTASRRLTAWCRPSSSRARPVTSRWTRSPSRRTRGAPP